MERSFDELDKQDADMFRSLMAEVKDFAVTLLDIEGNIIAWNTGAERLFGYKAGEILGKPFSVFFTDEDISRNMPAKELEVARKTGSAEDDNWVVRKDGSRFWASGVSTFIHGSEGRPPYFAKIIRDLTESKKIEEEKDQFIALVSHELRSPLHNIELSLTLLKEYLKDASPDVLEELDRISKEMKSLGSLVSNLLEEAMIRAHSFTFRDDIFDLNDLIKEVIARVSRKYVTHEVLIRGVKDICLFADRMKIGEVIENFLTNAIKYSPASGQVIIVVEATEEGLTVSVQDFGIGISEKSIAEVFKPFFRADNKKTIDQSIGLGLHIAKEIILHYKGRIWAESAPGNGSIFSFILPKDLIRPSDKKSRK